MEVVKLEASMYFHGRSGSFDGSFYGLPIENHTRYNTTYETGIGALLQ